MSVFEIGKDRYRVQVRRKGFPTYDQVFATRQLAEAAQARVLGEQKLVLKPGDITLNEAWERYRDSVDFSRKSASTQKPELTRIKPILAVLGEYSATALTHCAKPPCKGWASSACATTWSARIYRPARYAKFSRPSRHPAAQSFTPYICLIATSHPRRECSSTIWWSASRWRDDAEISRLTPNSRTELTAYSRYSARAGC